MTKKEPLNSENIDLRKSGEQRLESADGKEQVGDKKSGTTDIKNAHASGDGSFGRNDESLPETDADNETEKEESPY